MDGEGGTGRGGVLSRRDQLGDRFMEKMARNIFERRKSFLVVQGIELKLFLEDDLVQLLFNALSDHSEKACDILYIVHYINTVYGKASISGHKL